MNRAGKLLCTVLTLLLAIIICSIIVAADGGESDLAGDLKIGIVKNIVGDVMIDHELINYEVYGGEVIKKEERQLENKEIIYSNTIITTGGNSQLEFELLETYNQEQVVGSIVLKENSILEIYVDSFTSYELESGIMNVYLNGKSGKNFDFDSMKVIVKPGQEVEFEMQGLKKGGN